MFNLKECQHEGCRNPVLCLSEDAGGNINGFNNFCFLHTPDAGRLNAIASEYLQTHDKIVGMNLSYMHFTDKSLSGKGFYGCTFRHCVFTNVTAENFRMRMCVFDFSEFVQCMFLKANIQFTTFAGGILRGTHFSSSELVHNNFSGITAQDSSVDDTDLYNTRFIRAHLENTAITNCNLQRTVFIESTRQNVSFKLSSTREAIFSESEIKNENIFSS